MLDLHEVESLLVACDAAHVSGIIRPPGLNPEVVSRVLDAGAHGVLFADIQNKADAERAVASAKYPPTGTRGWGGAHTRYAMFEGLLAASALRESESRLRGVYSSEYTETANKHVLVHILIENPEGVDNLEEILEVPGIDGIYFGWADYSAQVDFDLAKCEAASEHIYNLCRARKVGMTLSLGTASQQPFYPGCMYVAGFDALVLSSGLRQVVESAKESLGIQ